MNDIPEELQERIAAYIDGQLSPSEAARFEVFLANTDPALADQVVGLLADKHAVSHLPRPQAPRELAAHIMEQIERTSLLHNVEEISAPHRRWFQSRFGIAAAIAVVIGGFTYFIYSSVRDSSNSEYRQRLVSGGAPPLVSKPQSAPDVDAGTAEKTLENNTAREIDGLGNNARSATVPQIASADNSALRDKDIVVAPAAPATPPAADAIQVAKNPSNAPIDHAGFEQAAGTQPPTTQLATADMPGPDGIGPMMTPLPPPDSLDANPPRAINEDAPGAGSAGGRRGRRGGAGRGGNAGGGGFGGAGGGGGAGGTSLGGASGFGGGGRGGRSRSGGNADASALQTNTPQKALTALMRESGTQPVVLALVPRDDQDVARLTASLQSFNLANRHDAGNSAAQTRAIGNTMSNTAIPNGNFDNSRNGQNNGGDNTLNNSQIYRDQGVDQQLRNNSFSLANGGANSNLGGSGNTMTGGAVQQQSAMTGPFRLLLSPAQLADLAAHFNITIVARGGDTYFFRLPGTPTGAPVSASADPRYRADMLRKVGINEFATNPVPSAATPARATQAPETAGTPAAAPPSRTSDQQNDAASNAPTSAVPHLASASESPIGADAAAPPATAPAFVDCVIILDTAPAPTTEPAPAR